MVAAAVIVVVMTLRMTMTLLPLGVVRWELRWLC